MFCNHFANLEFTSQEKQQVSQKIINEYYFDYCDFISKIRTESGAKSHKDKVSHYRYFEL